MAKVWIKSSLIVLRSTADQRAAPPIPLPTSRLRRAGFQGSITFSVHRRSRRFLFRRGPLQNSQGSRTGRPMCLRLCVPCPHDFVQCREGRQSSAAPPSDPARRFSRRRQDQPRVGPRESLWKADRSNQPIRSNCKLISMSDWFLII